MIVLVADTSVLIDLDRGSLLHPVFASGLTFAVPDALYDKELAQDNGPYLKQLGLVVLSLSPREVMLAQEVFNECRATLSLADCFALACATRAAHKLLTGDAALKAQARQRGLIVHGLLWLLDELDTQALTPRPILRDGLATILDHPRARLPHAEVQRRLKQWAEPR
jgi:hypothetical protein